MPWDDLSAIPDQVKTHDGATLSLAQANHWAEMFDALKDEPGIDNPAAVAWSNFKKVYKKEEGKWVKKKKEAAEIPDSEIKEWVTTNRVHVPLGKNGKPHPDFKMDKVNKREEKGKEKGKKGDTKNSTSGKTDVSAIYKKLGLNPFGDTEEDEDDDGSQFDYWKSLRSNNPTHLTPLRWIAQIDLGMSFESEKPPFSEVWKSNKEKLPIVARVIQIGKNKRGWGVGKEELENVVAQINEGVQIVADHSYGKACKVIGIFNQAAIEDGGEAVIASGFISQEDYAKKVYDGILTDISPSALPTLSVCSACGKQKYPKMEACKCAGAYELAMGIKIFHMGLVDKGAYSGTKIFDTFTASMNDWVEHHEQEIPPVSMEDNKEASKQNNEADIMSDGQKPNEAADDEEKKLNEKKEALKAEIENLEKKKKGLEEACAKVSAQDKEEEEEEKPAQASAPPVKDDSELNKFQASQKPANPQDGGQVLPPERSGEADGSVGACLGELTRFVASDPYSYDPRKWLPPGYRLEG